MGQIDFTYIGTLFFRSIQRFIIYLVVLMNAVFTTVESVNSQEPVDTILNRVYTMQYTQPDSCLALLGNLEFERSDELSPTNRAIVYYYQGNIYWYLQKLNTSILFYKKCLKEADQNDDSLRVVVVLSDIGYVFSDQDKNDSAIYYLHNSAIVVSPRIPSIIILIFSSEL